MGAACDALGEPVSIPVFRPLATALPDPFLCLPRSVGPLRERLTRCRCAPLASAPSPPSGDRTLRNSCGDLEKNMCKLHLPSRLIYCNSVVRTPKGKTDMPSTVLIGAQWGDEGKGKVTDLIAREYDYVVRYQAATTRVTRSSTATRSSRCTSCLRRHVRACGSSHRQRRGR